MNVRTLIKYMQLSVHVISKLPCNDLVSGVTFYLRCEVVHYDRSCVSLYKIRK